MTIFFSNPGHFDIRLLSTFGVNVKQGDNPIGTFGTGMKHAIGVVLRLGGTISIHTREEEYTIFRSTQTYRGKEVEMATLLHADGRREVLPFSTALGKNWKPWQAYREFFCNQVDEGNSSLPSRSYPHGAETVFAITCKELEAVNHHDWFLSGEPLFSLGDVEVFPGGKGKVFLRGICVLHLGLPSIYTYNLKSKYLTLTEDRTLDEWTAKYYIARGIASASESSALPMLNSVITADAKNWEHQLDFDTEGGKVFQEAVAAVARVSRASLTPTAWTFAKTRLADVLQVGSPPTEAQAKLLAEAEHHLAKCGFSLPQVLISDESSGKTLGTVVGGKVYLMPEAFTQGMGVLVGTLLEECLHLSGPRDFTREFQEAMHQVITKLLGL